MKEVIKKYNPIYICITRIYRRRLRNKNVTILSQNCLGGIIYNMLGLKFLSPTINLRIDTQKDFFNFCCNLDYYLQLPIIPDINAKEPYPVGYLGDIKIHFNHSKTIEEATAKWEDRKKRICFDNIYIIAHDYILKDKYVEKDDLAKWSSIKCNNLIIFTQKRYDDIPYTYYLGPKRFETMMLTNKITGLRNFVKYWDVVKWLNSKKDE